MIDLADNDPGLQEHAGRARRALMDLLGAAPQDAAQPAGTRFAHDVGVIRAIADGWLASLTDPAQMLAALSYTRTVELLAGGPPGPGPAGEAR
jgi:hypothetical protein